MGEARYTGARASIQVLGLPSLISLGQGNLASSFSMLSPPISLVAYQLVAFSTGESARSFRPNFPSKALGTGVPGSFSKCKADSHCEGKA